MANQIHAAFYTLVRNYRTWVALGLVAIDRAYSAWCVTQGVTYGLQDSIFRDKALVLVFLFAGASVAVFDQRGGALRSACGTERGRLGYVLSRFLTVAMASSVLIPPAEAMAQYSPRLKPAVTSAFSPLSRRTCSIAMQTVTSAACVYSVWSSLSFSSKHSAFISIPSSSVALSMTFAAVSLCS